MRNDELPEHYILDGKYEVVEVVGAGAYGITYKAIELTMKSFVAIKEFFPRSYVYRDNLRNVILDSSEYETWYQDAMDRFVREANILMQMKKNNGIVQVKNLIKKNHTAYMVMEFVDGRTLAQYIEEYRDIHGGKGLTVYEIQKLMLPLLKAVHMIHEQEIIHRDINPQNILLNSKGELILIDFGIAKEEPVGTKSSVIFNGNGEKGAYTAPEIYYQKGQGSWSDIYSLCGVLYYMATGQEPAPSVSENERALIFLEIPKMLKEGILNGLHPEPDKRPQSVEELISFLNGSIHLRKYLMFLLFGFCMLCFLPYLLKLGNLGSQNLIQRNPEVLKGVIEKQAKNRIIDELGSFDDFDFDGNGEMFAVVANSYDRAFAEKNIYLIEQAEIWYSDGKNTEKVDDIKEDENGFPIFYKALSLQMGKEKFWQLIRYYDENLENIKSVDIYKLENGKPIKTKDIQSEAAPVFFDSKGHYLLDYVDGGFTNGGFHFTNKVYIKYYQGELCYFCTEEISQEELEDYVNFNSVYKAAKDKIINGDICYIQFFNSFRCSNGSLYINIIKWPDRKSYMASTLGENRIWEAGQLPVDFQDNYNVGENYNAVFSIEENRLRLDDILPGFWAYPSKENEKVSLENWGIDQSSQFSNNEDAYEAYKSFLDIKNEYRYYSLKDVNGDGIDELFCATRLQKSTESELNLPILENEVGCLILGYDGKKVVTITRFLPGFEVFAFYYGEKGVYWTSRFQTYLITISDNQVSGGYFWYQTLNISDEVPKRYFINNEEVSEEKYNFSFKELDDMEEMKFQKNKF